MKQRPKKLRVSGGAPRTAGDGDTLMFRRRPILAGFTVALVAWGGLALRALAEDAMIPSPTGAASLHEGPLDMVATYEPFGANALAVTASFAGRTGTIMSAAPIRVVMPLGDGDDLAFSVPGYPQAVYRFTRSGATVSISVRDVEPPAGAGL
ncbi:MAG: hypothetical protein U1E59_18025 [Amaricoccus sp.]